MSRRLTIDGFEIHDGSDCYVIAEIGHNHQGDVELAKRLIDAAKECGVDAFKFASGDLRNTPLQRHVAAFGKPMLLSTGGGTMEDVERAVDAILPLNEQLCVLQCTAAYPASAEDLNLNVITTLRERFPSLV